MTGASFLFLFFLLRPACAAAPRWRSRRISPAQQGHRAAARDMCPPPAACCCCRPVLPLSATESVMRHCGVIGIAYLFIEISRISDKWNGSRRVTPKLNSIPLLKARTKSSMADLALLHSCN